MIGVLKVGSRHLEGASGVLAIVKAIMMLQRGEILPNAGFEKFNEQIEGKEKLKVCIGPKVLTTEANTVY